MLVQRPEGEIQVYVAGFTWEAMLNVSQVQDPPNQKTVEVNLIAPAKITYEKDNC